MKFIATKIITIALLLNSWSAIASIKIVLNCTDNQQDSASLKISSSQTSSSKQDIGSSLIANASLQDTSSPQIANASLQDAISISVKNAGEKTKQAYKRKKIQSRIDSILNTKLLKASSVSLLAVNLQGDTIACSRAEKNLVPASCLKIVPTGVSLRLLGSQYRFTTKIAYTGTIENGTLNGDIYIIGGGDPTLGARIPIADPIDSIFNTWATFIRDAGIQKINGRIIGDPRFFGDPRLRNITWEYDDLARYYGAGSTGLNFFENAQYYQITAADKEGDTPKIRVYYPETPWVDYTNAAVTGSRYSDNTVYLINSEVAPVAYFGGSFPMVKNPFITKASNRYGAMTCAYYFHNYLQNKGIAVSSGYYDITSNGQLRNFEHPTQELAANSFSINVIGQTESASLASIISHTNQKSDNVFAETLLNMIGTRINSEETIKALSSELHSMGIQSAENCRFIDGSGLSRNNFVSASFMVDFLLAMTKESEADIFYHSLPAPGEGTLEGKINSCFGRFAPRLRMKTGSMSGVRSYSGYLRSANGDPNETIVFSLLVNNYNQKLTKVSPYIDSIVEAIASYTEN